MRFIPLLCAGVVIGAVELIALAQKPAAPLPPSVEAPPLWQRTVRMTDGRTFVTDGGLAIDAAIARAADLPRTDAGTQGAATLERYMKAPYDHEIGLSDLQTGALKNTFVAPNGVVLNGNYVNFLRRTVPVRAVRLRVKGDLDPIVIVLDRQPIGVLMPVRR